MDEMMAELKTLIDLIKREARDHGETRSVSLALDVIELIIRSQRERLEHLEARGIMIEQAGRGSMRQEHLKTLRGTVESVKSEATKSGTTHTIAQALSAIEEVLRDSEERLNRLEAQAGS